MPKKFQDRSRGWAVAVLLALAVGQNAAHADASSAALFGRWTVSDVNDKFSANGKLYQTLDIAACGKAICGVSVDRGRCGATVFIADPALASADGLGGYAKWGGVTKEIVAQVMGDLANNDLHIEVGDKDAHLGSRTSLPTFEADYHRIGKAVCPGAARLAPGA